jgi:hypothetical protein
MERVMKRLWVAAICCWLVQPRGGSAQKLNVLFIAMDDLRAEIGLLRVAGHEVAEHRRAGEDGSGVQPRVLPAGGVQPVADFAHDRPRPDTTKIYDLETHFGTRSARTW